MKRSLAFALGILLAAPPAFAAGNQADPGYTISMGQLNYQPLGCAQLTSLSSATGFTVPSGSTLAAISVESQNVRYRDDGTNPTASVGLLLPVGGPWPYTGALSAIKFIETTGSAKIGVCFYKDGR